MDFRTEVGEPGSNIANSREAQRAERLTLDMITRWRRCAGASAVPGMSAAQIVAARVLEAYDETRVPELDPWIEPGIAITGLPAFLETGPDSASAANPTLDLGVARVRLDIAGDFEVDWGDGTSASYGEPGGPWPDGAITHTYGERPPGDSVTVAVSQTWRGTWTSSSSDPAFDGLSGDLPALPITRSFDLPIDEVQAIIQ